MYCCCFQLPELRVLSWKQYLNNSLRQASFVWYSTYFKGLELLCNEHILIMVLYYSVTDSRRPQCMTFIQNYGDTRKLVDGIFTFNFSDHFCAWISTFLWSSRTVLLVDQSTDNLIQLILNNPAATELISSIKGDLPVIIYSLHYWAPGWFNY